MRANQSLVDTPSQSGNDRNEELKLVKNVGADKYHYDSTEGGNGSGNDISQRDSPAMWWCTARPVGTVDSTITARLASTADKTSVQNTPHTHPPSTGTHTSLTCLVSSAAFSLCKQAKAAKGALCPGPGVQQAGKWTLAGSRRGSRGGMRRTEEAAGPACSTNRPLQQDFQTLLHH